jgi:hypothetical protein
VVLLVSSAPGDNVVAPPELSIEQILHHMDEHEKAMADALTGYTCLRRYSLDNRRFHKKAELSVRMTYTSPGHKSFEILTETGATVLRHKVLKPMLEAETEAGRDEVRPHTRMAAANYTFKLLGTPVLEGRPSYLLQVVPKTRNKFLIRGRIWIDAQDFGIMRVEAQPAQSPSMLIYNTHVIQQSMRFGEAWLPLFNHSNTDSFLFGHTDVTIDSWDYKMSPGASNVSSPISKSAEAR